MERNRLRGDANLVLQKHLDVLKMNTSQAIDL